MWGRSIAMVLKPSESSVVVGAVVGAVVGLAVAVGVGAGGFNDQSHLGSHMF
jgi:hypothetical protein